MIDARSARLRKGPRLDQQALSFVTPASSAEAHDDGVPGTVRLHAPREPGIARRQEFEIIEADAAQTRRAGRLHHQEITGAAAAMACPLRVQWLDHHQFRAAACLFRQALALRFGEFRRHPMCPKRRLDPGVSASTEMQCTALRRT